jgi:transketolase
VTGVQTCALPISDTLLTSAAKTGHVITAEEHSIIGGLGSACAEVLAERLPVPLRRVGVMDSFGTSGDPAELLEHFGLTGRHIATAAVDILQGR